MRVERKNMLFLAQILSSFCNKSAEICKQELSVVAMFVNGSGRNEQSL
jgi:hypothetical protein